MCDSDSAHTTSSFNASLQLSFDGVEIYLFGNTTNNLGYDITLDGVQFPGDPRPDLGLLYSAVGLEPGLHSVALTVRQPVSGSDPGYVTFREAVVSVGTGFTGATVTKKVLDDGDPSITYYAPPEGRWNIMDTYSQSIGPNGSTTFHDSYWTNASATVNFQGSGVAVYGACRSFPTHAVYTASMDGTTEVSYDGALNLYSTDVIQTAGNCLRYFKTGLDESKDHTLVLRVESGRLTVDWVEVFSASGGTLIGGGGRAPTPGEEPKFSASRPGAKNWIIGVVVGAVVLTLVLSTIFLRFRRRKRAQHNQLPDMPTSTQDMTQTGFSITPLRAPPPTTPRSQSSASLSASNPFAGGTRTSLVSSGVELASPDLSSLSTYSGSVSGLGWPESAVYRNDPFNGTASEDAHSNFGPAELGSAAVLGLSEAAGSSTLAVEGSPSADSIASGANRKDGRVEGTASPAPSVNKQIRGVYAGLEDGKRK